MKRVLVAGATGYLGGYIVDELKKRGVWVRALVRRPEQRAALEHRVDEIVVGQITDPETIHGIADGVDSCFSTVGITRQRDGLTYEAVDFEGNHNLLREALASGVDTFVYVSVLHGRSLRGTKLVEAKERFVDALIAAPLSHRVIRPTGFFSDMTALLDMAHRGLVVLLGDGSARINPISGRDLAVVCADAVDAGAEEVEAGGPHIYSQDEIAEIAFRVLRKRSRVWHVPKWAARATLGILRTVTPVQLYGPIEFFLNVGSADAVAPRHGRDNLESFLTERAVSAGWR